MSPELSPAAWPEVLLIADLAKLLRTSRSTIYAGLKDGTFPYAPLPYRIDRRLRWSRDTVLSAIAAGPGGYITRRWPKDASRQAQHKGVR